MRDAIITYYSGEKLRYRKDGQPDKRYKYGKRHAEISQVKTRISGRALPKKPKNKKVKDTFMDWLFKHGLILALVGCLWQAITTEYGGMDASLYVTPAPRQVSALEFNLESKRAYLENPVTIQETLDYIRYKFGDNYKVACMVAYSEGLVSNWVNSTPYERSVGTYQINLADNFGQGTRIHWNKVPGETLEAKEAWLKVRKNNIDLAYKMSNGGEDFSQWSGWSNKSYLLHEGKCL